ncbi:hypothetical protein NP493_593g01000 [Ridgeia piscesae]|uniref:TIMELESS-interacting protein n=1 Tax=Ridgeia piscesae TaxID=27915 RepID=A0AAD9NS86_RIDPI|nr:hypothetical protein NP493_593g01000 [Ridgeia piscesae]
MESIDLAMGDIFDGGLEEEDLAVPPPLPDLDDDTAAGGEHDGALNADDEETDATARDKTPKSAVKKRVLRPQPKLDAERLQSERGLPMLPKLFNNTKFKGKGYEAEDLKLVMGKLEHWAHRLFPKLTFDDFSARLEKLGHTKSVQTCIKRIRLDMPVTDDDFSGNPNKDNMSGGEENDADAVSFTPHGSMMDVEEAYEEMLQQERRQMAQQKTATPGGPMANESCAAGSSSDESSPRQLPRGTQSKSADMASPPMSSTGLSPHGARQAKMGSSQPSMTSEQQARIERNKQLAMQKRAARLGVPVTALASPKPSSKQPTDLSGMVTDVDNDDTPTLTVTAPTPPRHLSSAVAVTTDTEGNMCGSDSCDTDVLAADEDSEKSDENSTVTKKTVNKCTPGGATQKSSSQILDALENNHNHTDNDRVGIAKI